MSGLNRKSSYNPSEYPGIIEQSPSYTNIIQQNPSQGALVGSSIAKVGNKSNFDGGKTTVLISGANLDFQGSKNLNLTNTLGGQGHKSPSEPTSMQKAALEQNLADIYPGVISQTSF